jgi:hypothetical protein
MERLYIYGRFLFMPGAPAVRGAVITSAIISVAFGFFFPDEAIDLRFRHGPLAVS